MNIKIIGKYLTYIIILTSTLVLIQSMNKQTNSNCELFSDAVGICNNECTLTSCTPISREEFLKPITSNMKILEVGPYINPIFQGKNVKYFDVMSANDIKNQILSENNAAVKNYVLNDADLSKVPNIDYVDPKGDLSIIKEKFDVAFSSHNIEHQIDLINHLNQVAELLEENGKLYLIIPDKRFCFDHFIPESPLSDIIDNHYNNLVTHHPMRSILAMNCETTHNDAKWHWHGKHGDIKGKDFSCYQEAINNFNQSNGKYINAHRWRFTPQHFEFIINELYNMGLISLKAEKIYLTKENSQEFMALLYKRSKVQ